MGLQLDLNERVGEGEVDGISGGDLRDDLLHPLPRPHPGGRAGEVMTDLQREMYGQTWQEKLTGKYLRRKWSMGTPLSSGSCQERW